MPGTFTIIDVFRELGLDPESAATWPAGAQLRQAYLTDTGALPAKELRPKTNGGGGHCFAVYPAAWRERAREIARACATRPSPQRDLFSPEPAP